MEEDSGIDFVIEEEYTRALPKALPKRRKVVPPRVVRRKVVKKKVGKVVAYHADIKNPVPVPKQVQVISAFIPTFITAQNRKINEVTYAPSQGIQTTTFAPSGEFITTTYAPVEMI